MSKSFFQSLRLGFGLAVLLLLRRLPSSDSWIPLPSSSSPASSSSLCYLLRVVSTGPSSQSRVCGSARFPRIQHHGGEGSSSWRRSWHPRARKNTEKEPAVLRLGDDDNDNDNDLLQPVNGEQQHGGQPHPSADADAGDVLSSSLDDEILRHNVTLLLDGNDDLLPLSPPVSYDKFLKMQDKRVVVTVRYSGESGLRPYFLTVAKKLKASHPDVVIERRILPSAELDGVSGGEATFEILVDGKVVIGKKNRTRRQRVAVDVKRSRSVFVSMQELDVAISRARRRRRPNTAYGTHPDNNNDNDNEPVVEP